MKGRKYRRWTHEMVIERLRALHERGVPMTCHGVKEADAGLYGAAVRFNGSLKLALKTAGIERKPRNTIWNREKVIAEIERLRSEGTDLSASRVVRSHKNLYSAAIKYCISWDHAMALAGIPREEYRKKLDGARIRRTDQEITNALKALHEQGVEMSTKGIGRADIKLLRMAQRHFGDVGAALQTAGLEKVEPVNERRHREDSELLGELKHIHDDGDPVNSRALQLSHASLFSLLRYRFGSYDNALRAAGLDPAKVRKR